MRKLTIPILALIFLALPGQSLASSAKAVAESEVQAGEAQVYQSVETTVNGQTVKKESTQPGKLELEMKSGGGASPTTTFSQESQESAVSLQDTVTPSPTPDVGSPSTLQRFVDFFRQILGIFFGIFKSA